MYFLDDPPSHLRFASGPVTKKLVMALLKEWRCDDVVNLDGKHIGGRVPTFELVEEKEKADVRVEFGSMYESCPQWVPENSTYSVCMYWYYFGVASALCPSPFCPGCQCCVNASGD